MHFKIEFTSFIIPRILASAAKISPIAVASLALI